MRIPGPICPPRGAFGAAAGGHLSLATAPQRNPSALRRSAGSHREWYVSTSRFQFPPSRARKLPFFWWCSLPVRACPGPAAGPDRSARERASRVELSPLLAPAASRRAGLWLRLLASEGLDAAGRLVVAVGVLRPPEEGRRRRRRVGAGGGPVDALHRPARAGGRHRRLLRRQPARPRRLRPRIQGRDGWRAGDRGEAAVAGVAAGGAGVPQRGAAAAQGAAPQPRLPPRLLRRRRPQDARLPLLPQRQPRPHPLRQGKEGATRLAETVPNNPRTSKGPPLPPRRVSGEDHPQGHQGEQRAPRREAEPEDLGFRHGEALPRRRHARQHVQDLWHIWLYGPRVRDERLPVDQDRRFQLRDARAGDRQREEEHRPASRRRESRPVKLYMEAVRGRAVTGDRGPGPVRLGRRRGGDVRPARAAVLPGHRIRAPGHVQRAPHALQRLLHAAQAREAGDPRTGRPVEEHHRLGVQLRLRREHEQHVRYRHDEGLGAGKHC